MYTQTATIEPAHSPSRTATALNAVVVIPTYNESRNIEPMLRRVMALDGGINAMVVDDGSPDGTATIARTLQAEFPGRIDVIEREGKLGLGTAYITGFKKALDAGFDYICEMDADFSHNPSDLTRLINACRNGADLVIGSRYNDGVRVVDWPLSRLILSYAAGVYTRLVTRLPVRDVTAGFKCFKREVLEAIDLDAVKSNGYSFQIEMSYRAWKRGFNIVEIPIVFTERAEGESKMSKSIVREAIRKVWELRWLDLRGKL
ncbi:MAG: polyprenol monophosphomannose synthase [Rubricoccaceae bacterium]|nr:polyprenol monophosphomannose synthase [Rubricoccaceae bacterium]